MLTQWNLKKNVKKREKNRITFEFGNMEVIGENYLDGVSELKLK